MNITVESRPVYFTNLGNIHHEESKLIVASFIWFTWEIEIPCSNLWFQGDRLFQLFERKYLIKIFQILKPCPKYN